MRSITDLIQMHTYNSVLEIKIGMFNQTSTMNQDPLVVSVYYLEYKLSPI